jgi:hypothetical protein
MRDNRADRRHQTTDHYPLSQMLDNFTIKSLYTLALAEGEGMGTAYEYYVKRIALDRLLTGRPKPRTMLIAGLPEKYGASLDFVLLGGELGAAVTVVDERPEALARLQGALTALVGQADLPLRPSVVMLLADLDTLSAVTGQYDLALSSEVLQRLSPAGRQSYVSRLGTLASAAALFCPNAENRAHNTHSGLVGLRLEEMRGLTTDYGPQTTDEASPVARPHDANLSYVVRRPSSLVSSGYIDMPPFPPGITRSADQREEATSGRFEAMVMWGLGRYARGEKFLPKSLRRRQSHIVYAFIEAVR